MIAAALATFREKGDVIIPQGTAPALPDPDDAKFLHCAMAARAEYLVTGNRRHFPQAACGNVRVVGAGDLLDRIALEI